METAYGKQAKNKYFPNIANIGEVSKDNPNLVCLTSTWPSDKHTGEVQGFDNPVFVHDIKIQVQSPDEDEDEDHSSTSPSPPSSSSSSFRNELALSKRGSSTLDMDEHTIPLDILLQRYDTDLNRGLNDSQVQISRVKNGANVLLPPEKPSQFILLMKEFFAGLNILLWACVFLAYSSYSSQYFFSDDIVPDNCILGTTILLVILVSGIFAYYQEFKSNRIMESFKNLVPHQTRVLRNGRVVTVEVSELVAGDIVDIRYGDLIPADIRIINCQEFKVDNSGLTGESEPQRRTPNCTHDDPLETKNLAFFSTNAVEGHCRGLVVRVGSATFMGKLATMASKVDHTRTPIGIEMDLLIRIMTIRSIIFGAAFFTVAMFMKYSYLDAIFFVIGIVVANVPEGLCVTFTMVLALTAKRMAKKNCLVKNLHAVETLGSTSVICTDKTGTLTQNKMSVAHLWFNNLVAEADTGEFASGASFDKNDPGFKALANVAMLCSRAVFKPGQEDLPIMTRLVEGDASETAILKFMECQGINVIKYRSKHPKLCEIPFNSANKYQISIHDMRDPDDPRYLLVMKGAPERIIHLCSTILVGNKEHRLSERWKEEYNDVYASLGSLGERVLGFCDLRLPKAKYPIGHEFDMENPDFLYLGFRFLGLISMIDPPRSAVPDAVAKCRSAGIKVVMVTGDHPVTATAIARAVGIITPGHQTIEEIALSRNLSVDDIDPHEASAAVISGAELKLLTNEQLENVLQNYKEIVFARTSPEQKYRIVEAFQNLGHIVAATGDGVNDSPALKKADIGVAMGMSGTEVSKETADMILMDDNFTTIVTGVEEGRLIFDNLKKLIAYNLADNIAEMYSVWMFIILRCPLPMGTIAMLLSVIGTDVAPAISIAHETAESDIMKLKPRDPKRDKLVTPQLLSYTYGQTSIFELTSGFFTYFVLMGMNGWKPWDLIRQRSRWESAGVNDMEDSYGQEWTWSQRNALGIAAQTSFFASIVMTQISNVIICKTRRLSLLHKGMGNWNMNFSILIEIGLMCFFIYTPKVNELLILSYIPPFIFLAPIPFMMLMIFYDELRRYAVRTFKGGWVASEFYT